MGADAADDRTAIVYEVMGEGDPALVFVHCWSCNRAFWRHQAAAFAADHRVVLVDLPGHGQSGRDRSTWSIEGLAADVVEVVDHLGLGEVVLIGNSMGGPVSLAAARQMPGRVAGVICVDTLHDAEFAWPEGMTAAWVAQLEADREAFIDRFILTMFTPGADPALVAWVREQALDADPVATAALMRAFDDFDMGAALRAADVPVRCVNAAPAGERGMATAVATNRKYADFDAVLVDGVGHFLQLEAPERFNQELRRFLAELPGARRRGSEQAMTPASYRTGGSSAGIEFVAAWSRRSSASS